MLEDTAVLIAAASGRALATSARRAGFVPLVVDYFGDQDTLAAAYAHVRIEDGLARGMDRQLLLDAFESLATLRPPLGAVCGTGFEDRPAHLSTIARRWPLLGNSAETVRRIKHPMEFARICRECGIPHPEIALTFPQSPGEWLVKRRGGAGGSHIRAAAAGEVVDDTVYFQRRVAGIPVSALCLADGRRGIVLGFSMQWSSPTRKHPFRYGGAVQPADLTRDTLAALTGAVDRLLSRVPLVGLNSVDFLVDGADFHLLEVNPRPGATLDIFESPDTPLFALHIAACHGRLPSAPPILGSAAASAIVYAAHDIAAVPALRWPEWTADRPAAGSPILADQPICTVLAGAPTAGEAKLLAQHRAEMILAAMDTGTL
jgi:predicted ATP-grasp superfamily ATP-dependent carboligase